MYYRDGKLLNTEEIPTKNLEMRAKRIATRNMKNYHKSITFTGILHQLQPCIIEYVSQLDGSHTVVIDRDKYKELSKTAGIVKE